MRLLLITKDFPPDVGGIQTYCDELGKVFAERCEAFAVVAPRIPGHQAVDDARPYATYRVPCTRQTFAPLTALHLPRIHRDMAFDVVLGAQWQSAMPALWARSTLGPYSVFAAVHGREILTRHLALWPFGRQAYAASRRRVIGSIDGLLPVSRYALGLVEEAGMAYRRAAIVPNGCDASAFRPVDGEPLRERFGLGRRPVLLSMCRLVPRKGIDTVLEALPDVIERVPDVVYLIAGDGADRARLEALAAERGVADHVRFLGYVPAEDRLALYGASDVFVLAAREERPDVEGFGLVFLEASACGKPVVGTTSGGVPDAVADGTTGILVPPESPRALADALVTLLQDPNRASTMGAAGRRRVEEEGTWGHTARRILQQLEQWMHEVESEEKA